MAPIDPARLEHALGLVTAAVGERAFPGAVLAVGRREGDPVVCAFGHAVLEPARLTMGADTIFDLASLTKVVATTPAVLALINEGALALETPVRAMLPDFRHDRVTLFHLLTHTSGLPAWKPLYLDHSGPDEYLRAICQTDLLRPPGAAVEYSDLGFMLLGALAERASGLSLSEWTHRAVFAPLGMTETGWRPTGSTQHGPGLLSGAPRERIAATERANQVEYGMCGERAAHFTRWRRGVMWGDVNDGNAYYGLGGLAGHAGLFSTAADLARYARAWLGAGTTILHSPSMALATRNQTSGMAHARGLGWLKPPAAPLPDALFSGGELLSPGAFGHTGFTGTSLWIDPELDLYVILLTNRLHPVASDRIRSVRPALHNAVVAALA